MRAARPCPLRRRRRQPWLRGGAPCAGSKLDELPPHVFGLSERGFRAMLDERRPQALVISGESGAGKTEAKRQCLMYLAARTAIEGAPLF